MLRDNWRLIVIGLAVAATSFAGAYVISARSGDGAAPTPPARSPGGAGIRVPDRIESRDELITVSAQFFGVAALPSGGYGQYVESSDPAGGISVEVPAAWTATEAVPWLDEDDRHIGTAILSTPEASRFYQAWDTPGIFIGASRRIAGEGPDALLDRGRAFHEESCLAAGRGDFADEEYVGRYEAWYDCGEGPTVVVSAGLHPRETDEVIVAVYAKLVTAYDVAALERVLESLSVDPAAIE